MERIKKSELQTRFREWEPHLDRFLEKYPEFDKYEMLADLIRGEAVVWTNDVAFIIGRPNRYHTKEIFLLEALGGSDWQDWQDELDDIEQEVKAWGFDEIEVYGRLGWKKIMQGRGYSPHTIVMRKGI